MADYKYLEDERKKLWDRISAIEKHLNETPSALEVEIRTHADKARQCLMQAEEDALCISEFRQEASGTFEATQHLSANFFDEHNRISKLHVEFEAFHREASLIVPQLQKWQSNIKMMFDELSQIYANNPDMQVKLKEFDANYNKADELFLKADATYKSINTRKSEIDSLYYAIAGHASENEDGTTTKTPGLKDKLSESYAKLEADFASLQVYMETENNKFMGRIEDFENLKSMEFKTAFKSWNTDHDAITKKIEELLPRALTAGLSHAFSEKKVQEDTESKQHAKSFMLAIVCMMTISLIPICASLFSLYKGEGLDATILKIPRLVLAILPLYIPALWFAYSSNRKGNLSKRLIEEYSHKEALSKTYEGLAKQISSISDKCDTNGLQEKLLYTILEVSAENPGKLISDYNKADHPLMDALDKSIKLTNSLEKLAKIPGFGKIATSLSAKAEKVAEAQAKKVNQGIDAVTKN